MLICAQYILPVSSEPIRRGAVLVRDGIIRDIGSAERLRILYPDDEIKDYGWAAVMPGIVDLSTNLENSVMRGLLDDVPYATWMTDLAEKGQAMEMSDWYDSAFYGGLDSIAGGVTTVADITSTGAVCTAVQKLGLRGVIYREVRAMDKKRIDYAMKLAEQDIFHWKEEVDSDRITIGISPASTYASHPAVYKRVSSFAIKENLPVAMKLAESSEEVKFVKYGSSPFSIHKMENRGGYVEIPPWLPTGESPVRYALNWGAFDAPNTMVINAVHVDDADIRKFKEFNVSIATCPRANAQLGMGVAPVSEFLRAGLRVGLGTSSPAATNSTDMFTEMRLAMLLQRAVYSRSFLENSTVLELATLGGARALGLDDKIGSLEIGKCADIIAVDLSSSHQAPASSPISTVVNTASSADVLLTMVNGKILYEKSKWHVDVEVAKNLARVIEIRSKLRV
ncbi:MAG: amidohydrolase family protein [Eggerthellaceae bacterium]|nr:amidohydrolase family protein [Eggerthellaceae bacterium]